MEELPPNRKDPAARPQSGETSPLPPPRPRGGFRLSYLVIGLVVLILAGAVTFYYILFIAPYESTDDGFIAGNSTFISPRVSGPVVRLLVNDNQRVKAGDLLVEIDPVDYETRLGQARADLATANARVEQAKTVVAVDEAKLEQEQAAVTAAEAIAARAQADQARYEAVESRAISQTQLDLANSQSRSAVANVSGARSQVKAAAAQLETDRANIAVASAQVEQAQTQLKQAELNVSYTKVKAPIDGRVSGRSVQVGAYVQVGQALMSIVPNEVWVIANFKETQLKNMRPGQPVSIRLDAYPQYEFKGKVDSLQAGSGAVFSLLPPENAVGNYVKVVQRIPVKIVFDEPIDKPGLDIAEGMSVEPRVRVK